MEFGGSNWKKFIDTMKQQMTANEIAPEQQVGILLKNVGGAVYSVISELCAPELPEEKTFDEIARLVGDHLKGKPELPAMKLHKKPDYTMALKAAYQHARGAWRASDFRAKAAAAAEATARGLRRMRLSFADKSRGGAGIEIGRQGRVTRGGSAAVLVAVEPNDRYFLDNRDSTMAKSEFNGDNLVVKIKNTNVVLEFVVDAESKTSTISKRCYGEYFKTIPRESAIEESEFIRVIIEWGQTTVPVQLFLVENGDRPLLGRDWMESQVYREYPEVFSDSSGLGTCRHKLKLHVKDATPVYRAARPLPPPLQECVGNELLRLEREGVIYRVERSDYGTPIVPIVKKKGGILICAEYNTTINPKIEEHEYRMPRVALVCAALHEGQHFTRLELSDAHRHMLLEQESQPLTAITTHLGTFAYRRVPFGLKGTLGSVQIILEEILKGLNFAIVLDDIWVTGRHWAEHVKNLRAVLDKLKDAGFRINWSKCDFFGDSVRYVGYGMNKSGLFVDRTRLRAITDAPRPKSASELKCFLGLANYYRKFCLDCYCILKPLYSLLEVGAEWKWNGECETAFAKMKCVLTSFLVSAVFVEELPMVLAVASGAYGVGAVLSHVDLGGNERPIACASRALTHSEAARCRLDKEVLALAFGVQMHRQYLYGNRFVVRSNQPDLSHIFSEKGGLQQAVANCLQWDVAGMADYQFEVQYAPAADNENAIALSRLPLPRTHTGRRSADNEDSYLYFIVGDSPLKRRPCLSLCC